MVEGKRTMNESRRSTVTCLTLSKDDESLDYVLKGVEDPRRPNTRY